MNNDNVGKLFENLKEYTERDDAFEDKIRSQIGRTRGTYDINIEKKGDKYYVTIDEKGNTYPFHFEYEIEDRDGEPFLVAALDNDELNTYNKGDELVWYDVNKPLEQYYTEDLNIDESDKEFKCAYCKKTKPLSNLAQSRGRQNVCDDCVKERGMEQDFSGFTPSSGFIKDSVNEASDSYSALEADVKQLKSQYPDLSFGYLGNLDSKFGDDRDWFVFAGNNRRWGGYRTKELDKMLTNWNRDKERFLNTLSKTNEKRAPTCKHCKDKKTVNVDGKELPCPGCVLGAKKKRQRGKNEIKETHRPSVEDVMKEITDGNNKYYGYSHFDTSNMADYQTMSDTINDLESVYGFSPEQGAEIVQGLTHDHNKIKEDNEEYTVSKTGGRHEKEVSGTLDYLKNYFSYKLINGNSHDSSIDKDPKTIKSLITNLNKAVDVTQGGYNKDFFQLKESKSSVENKSKLHHIKRGRTVKETKIGDEFIELRKQLKKIGYKTGYHWYEHADVDWQQIIAVKRGKKPSDGGYIELTKPMSLQPDEAGTAGQFSSTMLDDESEENREDGANDKDYGYAITKMKELLGKSVKEDKLRDPEEMKAWLDKEGVSAEQYAKDENNPTDLEIRSGYLYFLQNPPGKEDVGEAKNTKITGEYVVSVSDIGDFEDVGNATGIGYVDDALKKDIKSVKANVKVDKIEFVETDSSNISHAGAYYAITLSGTEEELNKIAGEEGAVYYDWEDNENDTEWSGKYNLMYVESTGDLFVYGTDRAQVEKYMVDYGYEMYRQVHAFIRIKHPKKVKSFEKYVKGLLTKKILKGKEWNKISEADGSKALDHEPYREYSNDSIPDTGKTSKVMNHGDSGGAEDEPLESIKENTTPWISITYTKRGEKNGAFDNAEKIVKKNGGKYMSTDIRDVPGSDNVMSKSFFEVPLDKFEDTYNAIKNIKWIKSVDGRENAGESTNEMAEQTVNDIVSDYVNTGNKEGWWIKDIPVYSYKRFDKIDVAGEKDTFGPISAAEKFLKEKGYSRGSMDGDSPIAFANADKYENIAKWHNIDREEYDKLDGVIVPEPEFREGGVVVLFFKKDNPLG